MARPKKQSRIRPTLLSRRSHKSASVGFSSKASRAVINRHHTLQKQLSQALAKNDHIAAATVQKEIEANGGLERYQQASITGQSEQRGGDSSKVLMDWILEKKTKGSITKLVSKDTWDMLEIGALSVDNACSKSMLFNVSRIDLHSQHPRILSQDFMQRPLPVRDGDRFDIISLSLVLNYVPSPSGRGEMLRRTTQFLRYRGGHSNQDLAAFFPSLFLVLPAPCVTNSRYMDEKLLSDIMESLGYKLTHRKLSTKLIYQLWVLVDTRSDQQIKFAKQEINPGKTRNNFAIVLE